MITVKQLQEALAKLIEQGHGDALIANGSEDTNGYEIAEQVELIELKDVKDDDTAKLDIGEYRASHFSKVHNVTHILTIW